MATLIAHSTEPAAYAFAQRLATALKTQRGVTTAVESFSRAGRYLDNVEAVIVVAEADHETFNRAARNFLNVHYADLDPKSVFIAALGEAPELTETQLAAMAQYKPRDTAYFRTNQLDETAMTNWVGTINSRGAN